IFAENSHNAGTDIAQAVNQNPESGYSMRPYFDQVDRRNGCGLMEARSCNRGRSSGGKVKLGGKGGINGCDLRSSIQKKVVGPRAINRDGQNNLLAVNDVEG